MAGTVNTDSFGVVLCRGADGNGPGLDGLSRHANVGFWHIADLRLAAPEGPLTSGLPALGAECLVSGSKPAVFSSVLNVGL